MSDATALDDSRKAATDCKLDKAVTGKPSKLGEVALGVESAENTNP